MKLFRKIFALLIVLTFIIPAGCSAFFEKAGFIALNDTAFKKSNVFCIDTIGDKLVFGLYDEDTDKESVQIWNLKKNRQIASKDFKTDEENTISDVKLTNDDNLIIYDDINRKQYKYDFEFNLISEDKYVFTDEAYVKAEKSKNIDNNMFVAYESYASKVIADKYESIVFYVDDDNTYFQERNQNIQHLNSKGKQILYCEEKSNALLFYINDYSSFKTVNSAQIAAVKSNDMTKIPFASAFGDKYICVPLINDSGYLENIYFWNYSVDEKNEPFEAQVMNNDEIDKACKSLITAINKEFAVNVELNPKFDTDKFSDLDYEFTDNKIPSTAYLCLQALQYTMGLYPEGIFEEIGNEFDYKYRIVITGKLKDDSVGAYANNCNGYVYIVLPTFSFTIDNISHEIMHTMEYKLSDIDGKWDKLNPKNFSYDDYETDNELPYEESEKYFVRPYGMANQLEDRAVTMEGLFIAGVNNQSPDFLKQKAVRKKAELLCTEIRKAYKSVQKAENVIWEKYI